MVKIGPILKKYVHTVINQLAEKDGILTIVKREKMRIKAINHHVRKATVYDIETPTHDYILWNKIISHNTMEMYSKNVMSGGCVVAGSEILMSDGTFKSIEDVAEGELVQTLLGDKEVSATWNPETLMEGEPECYEIKFEDGTTVICSQDHSFLDQSVNVWTPASDLMVDDIVTRGNKQSGLAISKITKVGRRKVYDISVRDAQHYILKNGVVSHNTGGMYSANQVFIIGKAQEKDGTDLIGYKFTINIEKSRFVREKSKFPFIVTYTGGVDKWSGLLDIALESGHVIKPKVGWYNKVDMVTGEVSEKAYREKNTHDAEFWNSVISCPKFKEFTNERYCVGAGSMMEEDTEVAYDNLEEDAD